MEDEQHAGQTLRTFIELFSLGLVVSFDRLCDTTLVIATSTDVLILEGFFLTRSILLIFILLSHQIILATASLATAICTSFRLIALRTMTVFKSCTIAFILRRRVQFRLMVLFLLVEAELDRLIRLKTLIFIDQADQFLDKSLHHGVIRGSQVVIVAILTDFPHSAS